MDPHKLRKSLREFPEGPPPTPGPELQQVAEAKEEPPTAEPVSRKRIREDPMADYKLSVLFHIDIHSAVELYKISNENLAREREIASRAVFEFKESDEFQNLVCKEGQNGVKEGYKIFQDISHCHPELDLTSLEFKNALQYLPPSTSGEDTD